jgi:predicted dehydrogenase
MTGANQLRVGITGYGMMGRAHCYGYRVAPLIRALPVTPVVTVMSGRDRAALAAAAAACGVPDHVTDWRRLVERDDVDMVDICTPPGTHAEIAQAAAAAGKAVLCEKPLAVSYAQAMAALAAVTRAGVHNAVGFNYRRLPAVALMHRMVADGAVGEVGLWRASWLSDEFTDPATPWDWRFDRAMGGTTIADLGSHLIDLARWMVGRSARSARSRRPSSPSARWPAVGRPARPGPAPAAGRSPWTTRRRRCCGSPPVPAGPWRLPGLRSAGRVTSRLR